MYDIETNRNHMPGTWLMRRYAVPGWQRLHAKSVQVAGLVRPAVVEEPPAPR